MLINDNKTIKVFAHRGASGYFPENTMLAFRKAVEMNADGIEVDVQITKDGVIVICHDEKIDRTTNGKGFVRDMNYSEILQYDAGQGEAIPTLDDFLALCAKNSIIANIELKNDSINYEGLEEAVLSMLHNHNMLEKTIISSFNHMSMKLIKSICPDMKTSLIYHEPIDCVENYAVSYKADAIHPFFDSIDKNIIDNCHKNGIAVNVWTLDRKEDMEAMINLGVDGIFTNLPDVCKSCVSKKE